MSHERMYWGPGGMYGPFSAQNDGWPNAGEVIRHYRLLAGLSAQEVARLYSKRIGKQVDRKWVLEMETKNKVPTDITRRRVLADILNIPPVLLGLASIDALQLQPETETTIQAGTTTAPTVMAHTPAVDMEQHDTNIRLFWRLHYTSNAYEHYGVMTRDIAGLEQLAQVATGNLASRVMMLLYSYYRLMSIILRDQRQRPEGLHYADVGIQVANTLPVSTLRPWYIAAAQFQRGCTYAEWGLYGFTDAHGRFQLNTDYLKKAVFDFEEASPHASPQLQGVVAHEWSRALAVLKQSETDTVIVQGMLENAQRAIGKSPMADPYEQTLVDGTYKGLTMNRHLVASAATLTRLGRNEKAIELLDDLEKHRVPETRRNSWAELVYADAALGMHDYGQAIFHATQSAQLSKDVNSVANLAIARDIYSRLPRSYHDEAKELKRLLRV